MIERIYILGIKINDKRQTHNKNGKELLQVFLFQGIIKSEKFRVTNS